MRNQLLLLASIFLGFGCASEGMQNDTGELSAALADQRAENARHEQVCEAADSMTNVLLDLDRHEQAMGAMMARMDQGMGEMSSCASSDTSRAAALMSDVRTELSGHDRRLRAAADLTAAHYECTRYAPMMDAALLWTKTDLEQMSCMMMHH